MGKHTMQFLLTGFHEKSGFRVFEFEGVSANRERTAFTVQADLTLARRYGITLQELPLLCRSVLDRLEEGYAGSVFTFSEDEMRSRALAQAARRLAERRPRNPRGLTVTQRPAEDDRTGQA
jgi:hypothetical protein